MSLVVAMLATSNVPVWAAEFSDGSDATVATEAPVAETFSDDTAEAPVVDDTTDTTPATAVVESSDLNVDVSVSKSATFAKSSVAVSGTIKTKAGADLTKFSYGWRVLVIMLLFILVILILLLVMQLRTVLDVWDLLLISMV